MNRLLLASGLAMTKQAISEFVHRTMLKTVGMPYSSSAP